MEIKKKVCDNEKHKYSPVENARTYQIFSERKADGAGGMENWYYSVDLCENCEEDLLNELLNQFPKESKISMDRMKLKGRLV